MRWLCILWVRRSGGSFRVFSLVFGNFSFSLSSLGFSFLLILFISSLSLGVCSCNLGFYFSSLFFGLSLSICSQSFLLFLISSDLGLSCSLLLSHSGLPLLFPLLHFSSVLSEFGFPLSTRSIGSLFSLSSESFLLCSPFCSLRLHFLSVKFSLSLGLLEVGLTFGFSSSSSFLGFLLRTKSCGLLLRNPSLILSLPFSGNSLGLFHVSGTFCLRFKSKRFSSLTSLFG